LVQITNFTTLSELYIGRIRDPRSGKNLYLIPGPGPEVKKAPDPGSGSATLLSGPHMRTFNLLENTKSKFLNLLDHDPKTLCYPYPKHWPEAHSSRAEAETAILIKSLVGRCCKSGFSKVHLYEHNSKRKSQEVAISRNTGFSSYFCLMMEGSGTGPRSASVQIMTDPDHGGPKIYENHGTGSPTLV
jgi:hypothetical protein